MWRARSLTPYECKQHSREFFSVFFRSFLQIFAKSVYEPNFAFFFVISTLIFRVQCLKFFIFCVSVFVGDLPHKKGVCIRSPVLHCFNHLDSKWRVKYSGLFVVGAFFHAIWMQTKLSRNFLQRSLGVSSEIFAKNVYEPNFAFFFRYFNFNILLTVLDVFHVLCFVFGGGLPHKKGVCRRSLELNCFNHFDSKSRVKFLVLCVVGALYHAIRMQTKPSRIFFSAFWEFPPNSCKKRLWAKFCIFFGDFNLHISHTVLDVFQFLCFGFCRGFTS